MGRFVTLVIALSALWLLLSGFFDKPLLLAFGVASVLFTSFIALRARVLDDEGVPGRLLPGAIGYWVWLTKEIGKSNLAVARLALSIEPNLSPAMFKVPVTQKSHAGIVTFANSITLTPGTVSVNLYGDELHVHALTEDFADIAAIEDMGARVTKIEGAKAIEGPKGEVLKGNVPTGGGA